MVEMSCEIAAELADELEVALSEYVRCNWVLQQDRDDTPWFLRGYFETAEEAAEALAELRGDFPQIPADLGMTELDDRDWQEAYKAYLKPWSCGPLHWVPEWQRAEYTAAEGDAVLFFDAGMAFGTGSHETTRLMARRLLDFTAVCQQQNRPLDAPRVIDAGCGSGILALSAALLGYRQLFAFDRDAEAMRVSRENVVRNGLPEDAVLWQEAGLEEGLKGRSADLLLANIISDVLIIHAHSLLQATAAGGWLALSGILARESDKVREAFLEASKTVWEQEPARVDVRLDGEWSDLLLVRPQ